VIQFELLDPGKLSANESYRVLSNLVIPRPIALVSSMSKLGIPNLAPFSFFVVGGANPPSVVFSPVLGSNGEKDTLVNIRETGEYVINLVHREMTDGMNQASRPLPSDENEWDISGFEGIESHCVAPKRVASSMVQLECKLFQILEHGEGIGAARYVVGEVVMIHRHPELAQFHPISRLGDADYLDLQDGRTFQLDRPG
jgi:flavin reductase (DIM6/NTAB) family NADH-FMN oxidoreductase RutF